MTATQLCKAIKKLVTNLPGEATSHTLVVYAKTWSIVCLYVDGLIRPLAAAAPRLADLYNVINNIRADRVIVTREAAEELVKGRLNDDYGVAEATGCLWLTERRAASTEKLCVGAICPTGSPLAAFNRGLKELREINSLV